jgi:succinyl-CoA synthetase beta subunit
MHSHVIDNETIWHSHPFTSNNHTKSAADTIAQINHLIFTEEVEHVEINPQIITFAPITFFVNNQVKAIVEHCKFLRAPPVYI